jgi:hypothetical protein
MRLSPREICDFGVRICRLCHANVLHDLGLLSLVFEAVGGQCIVARDCQLKDPETQMIERMIKSVVLGVFLTALLLTLPALTQVVAQTGMGGGAGAGASGAGAGASGAGAGAGGASGASGAGAGAGGVGAGGGYGGGFIYHPDQDSSYASTQPGWSYATKRLSTKATKKHRKAM